MQTADFNVEDFESREAADKRVYVKFYVTPVLDQAASDEQGRPIYRDKDYVEIRVPGDQTNIIQRPVTDMDKRRFSKAYALFKEGAEEQLVGTPLTEVPWITRSQVEELAYIRIRTLEHLAEVKDDVCTKMPGLYKLKQRAQVAVEKSEKSAPVVQLQKENDDIKAKLAALEITVQEQADLIRRLNAEAKSAKPAK